METFYKIMFTLILAYQLKNKCNINYVYDFLYNCIFRHFAAALP